MPLFKRSYLSYLPPSAQQSSHHSTMSSLSSLILILLFLIPSSLCKTTSKTVSLDISSTLHKTLALISGEPEKNKQISSTLSLASSPLSFSLHSRISLHRAHRTYPDYRALTRARLDGDSVRVQAVLRRVDMKVSGISVKDMKPLENEDSVLEGEKLKGPVVSGSSQGSGEYFSRMGIGRPPTQVSMVLDTGSDVNWVQCAPCADCYQQADPIFEPTASSSYSPLTCSAHQCESLDVSECRNNSCLYEVSYGDGSYTVGDFATETITFNDESTVGEVAIGCGHNNEGLFIGAGGLIGLGGGPLSFPSQINATSFSYCLVDRDSDSSSTLEFDSTTPEGAIAAPLIRNGKLDTFYYIGLADLSVAGKKLSISPSAFEIGGNGHGGVIVDSGTAVSRLTTDAYNSLRDAFVKATTHLPKASSVALFDTCYDLSSMRSAEVPTVLFHFSNGKSLSLPAKNYMVPVDSAGTFCFAFAPTSSSLSIIGNIQQQGTRVSFDLANSLIGFTADKC